MTFTEPYQTQSSASPQKAASVLSYLPLGSHLPESRGHPGGRGPGSFLQSVLRSELIVAPVKQCLVEHKQQTWAVWPSKATHKGPEVALPSLASAQCLTCYYNPQEAVSP